MNSNDNPDIFPEAEYAEVITSQVILKPLQTEVARFDLATQWTNSLLEQYDAPTAFVIIKQLEDTTKMAIDQLKEKALAQFDGKKEMSVLGAKVQCKKSVEWEYNDTELNNILIKKKEIAELEKNRKRFLESLAGHSELCNTETGEVLIPAVKVKDGLTISVTLPK